MEEGSEETFVAKKLIATKEVTISMRAKSENGILYFNFRQKN
jgi:hypothetical protein